MRRLLLVLAFALTNFAAHARDATQDPLAYIKAIYAAYKEETPRPSLTEDFYSRRMQRLLDADAKTAPKGDAARSTGTCSSTATTGR